MSANNLQAATAAQLKARLVAAINAGRKAEVAIIGREVARRAAMHQQTAHLAAPCNRVADRLLSK